MHGVPAQARVPWDTVEVVRRRSVLCVAAVVVLALSPLLQSCASEPRPRVGQPDIGNTILPDPTTPAPGTCDPLDLAIPAPTITVDGKSLDATFGVGTYQCGTITGDGYVVNNFNPALLDAGKPSTIKVKVNSNATAKFVLGLGGEFTQTGDGEWTSSQPISGCDRLTVTLKSPSGLSRATYGVDIRVGGEATECPQRVIDPTDVGAIVSIPPGSTIDIPVESVVVDDPADTVDTVNTVDTTGTTTKQSATTKPTSTTAPTPTTGD